ncbi:Dehydrogenase (flavoprotein) [Epsilonproteobacteria bacterium SCGC AD-308-E02]|nr:Dehydrogenase (flavoprotein) [Epsilonproteobacteria bacterium SCGC AD-308-E02]SMP86446.1 Dehydrogenase (flavoprotein) [Epsilonproteobacteria bacterium SCGC AD-308-O04]
MEFVDVFIIGAGPAGSIAGAKLTQEGFSVKIVDKLKFPRFVIGESLLPRCNELLEDANMLTCIQKADFQLKGGAIFESQYDDYTALDFSKNLGQKWGSSFQVKREEFDKLLIDDAREKGCDVEYETEVTAYDENENIVTVKNLDGDEKRYKAKKVLDASGYGRVLPRLLNLEAESSLALRRATFARVDNDTRPNNETHGYIIISVVGDNDAWIWNIPFSDGTTSVGIVCTEEYFKAFEMSDEEFWEHIIYAYPPTAQRYKNSKRTVDVGSLVGYSAAVTKLFAQNYILTGNASEFLDPVFSSGVTLALESGSKAAELVARELKGEAVDYKVEYEDYMMMGINVFRDYVNAWYDGTLQAIIFSDKANAEVTKKIVSILSGYVWDKKNSFVTSSRLALKTTYEILK